jgi:hypothetical protein
MAQEYTKEELLDLYEKLSEELKETIFSEKTADYIRNICQRHSLGENQMSNIAKNVGNVLLGILSPNDFSNTLKSELSIDESILEKIVREINRLIFYPVKPALEQLYGANANEPTAEIIRPRYKKTSGEDKYREVIE